MLANRALPPNRLGGLGLLTLATACAQGGGAVDSDSAWLSTEAPEIVAITASCDPAFATWSFQVDTTGWTGGGALWMAERGDRVERHGLSSVSAAADGSTDRLSLSLSAVADWRYAVEGSSTAWRCVDEDALSFQITVYTRDGADRADCRTWGADPSLWDRLDEVPDCATVLEDADDTG